MKEESKGILAIIIIFMIVALVSLNVNDVSGKKIQKEPNLKAKADKVLEANIGGQAAGEAAELYKKGQKFDLKNYPNMFIKDGKFNGILVVGDRAPVKHVIGITDIITSLQYVDKGGVIGKIEIGSVKLASEVASINQNIISVGNACVNPITAQIKGNPKNCKSGLTKGKGIIRIYSNKGNAHIIVEGLSPEDTKAAANVLANYKDYNLKGQQYIVKS